MFRYSPSGLAVYRRAARGVILALLFFIGDVHALVPIDLVSPDFKPISLYGHFEIFIDDRGGVDLAEVTTRDMASKFFLSTPRDANFGLTNDEIWARFSIRYGDTFDQTTVLVIDEALIDHIDLYAVNADGSVARSISGDGYPFHQRNYHYRNLAFELEAEPGITVAYYLRIRSETSAVSLPMSLYTEADFHSKATTENFLLGGYFGLMGGLSLSAFLLFVIGRKTTFLYYFLYLGFFALLMCAINGYGTQFLWSNSPIAQDVLPKLLMVLTVVIGILFTRQFLDMPKRLASSDRSFLAVVAMMGLGLITYLLIDVQVGILTMMACGMAALLIVLAGAFRLMMSGDRVARDFLIGFAALFAGLVATSVDALGLVASSAGTTYGLLFGSMVQFFTLSIALGKQLWILQHQKEEQIKTVNADLASLNDNLDEIVKTRTLDLEQRNRELSDLAIRDSLTGLFNHSTTIELLEQLLHQSRRYEFPIATIMLDIDHFKPVNDTYGHQTGDKVLETISQALTESVREADVVGRYGGEEFIIIMPHADAAAAREYGERLLQRIREISIPNSKNTRLSASIGISVFHPLGQTASAPQIIQRADEALYRSKRDGRDRLTVESLTLVDTNSEDGPIETPSTRG